MTNILDGIQYRTLNPALPSWNKDIYTDWLEAKELTIFPSGTQFRVPPVFNYVVESRSDDERFAARVELNSTSKDSSMKTVARLVEEGKAVKVEKHEAPTETAGSLLAGRNVQFKVAGQDKWTHAQYLITGSIGTVNRIEFRVRPDLYWEVTTTGATSASTLAFDDVEAAHTYVNRQMRTSDFDLTIKKVRYAG